MALGGAVGAMVSEAGKPRLCLRLPQTPPHRLGHKRYTFRRWQRPHSFISRQQWLKKPKRVGPDLVMDRRQRQEMGSWGHLGLLLPPKDYYQSLQKAAHGLTKKPAAPLSLMLVWWKDTQPEDRRPYI